MYLNNTSSVVEGIHQMIRSLLSMANNAIVIQSHRFAGGHAHRHYDDVEPEMLEVVSSDEFTDHKRKRMKRRIKKKIFA